MDLSPSSLTLLKFLAGISPLFRSRMLRSHPETRFYREEVQLALLSFCINIIPVYVRAALDLVCAKLHDFYSCSCMVCSPHAHHIYAVIVLKNTCITKII